ncbi:hypothetical protein BsWGS_07486 [Bradybaena similaris]
MAASTKVILTTSALITRLKPATNCKGAIRNASWSGFFKKSKPEKEAPEQESEVNVRKAGKYDGPLSMSRLESLKRKVSVYHIRGYKPPNDVEEKVVSVASAAVGTQVSPSFRLDDRVLKFKVLTKLMVAFDHGIPNNELSNMNTIQDVVNFFSTPVHDRSSFDDMAKLNLPKNLHIQYEPIRFDPDTDTFFDGKTAFPGRPTVVTDLKYCRKYKGNSGQSRNEKSVTEFELQHQLEKDYARLGIKDRRRNRF